MVPRPFLELGARRRIWAVATVTAFVLLMWIIAAPLWTGWP